MVKYQLEQREYSRMENSNFSTTDFERGDLPCLLIATRNPGKLVEFKALLRDIPVRLLALDDLGIDEEIEEIGSTYAENATLKARAYAEASGLPVLADDSGLEVAVLDGAPGIRSRRYVQKTPASDADRRAYLLERLSLFPRPWLARFCCVVAIVSAEGRLYLGEGVCHGEIIPEERGSNGFGYDPIFLIPEYGLTMAELTLDQKNRISHRARALKAVLPVLLSIL